MREATFTALPQISYCGLQAPITPATTGPMLMPEEEQERERQEMEVNQSSYTRHLLLLSNLPPTYAHAKVVEGMHVDLLNLVEELQRIIRHSGDMAKVNLVAGVGRQPRGGHVGGTSALDFLNAAEGDRHKKEGSMVKRRRLVAHCDYSPETLLAKQLIEIGNNLVEQPQAFDALVVALQFHVELGEVWYASEEDAHGVALLVVKILQREGSQMYQIRLNT